MAKYGKRAPDIQFVNSVCWHWMPGEGAFQVSICSGNEAQNRLPQRPDEQWKDLQCPEKVHGGVVWDLLQSPSPACHGGTFIGPPLWETGKRITRPSIFGALLFTERYLYTETISLGLFISSHMKIKVKVKLRPHFTHMRLSLWASCLFKTSDSESIKGRLIATRFAGFWYCEHARGLL